jgi:F-type H+-transporting ATPase subunit b
MRWIFSIVGAILFWLLSTTPFIKQANEVAILKALDLNLQVACVQIGVIILMFPLVEMLFIKPLKEAMDARSKELEDTFAEADQLKQRMLELKQDYERRLEAAEAEAREKIQAALNDANQMKESILAEARQQAEDIRQRTLEDLEQEKQKLLVDLRSQVVELTLMATEKLIGESMDEQKQRELVERFIETAEVKAR